MNDLKLHYQNNGFGDNYCLVILGSVICVFSWALSLELVMRSCHAVIESWVGQGGWSMVNDQCNGNSHAVIGSVVGLYMVSVTSSHHSRI